MKKQLLLFIIIVLTSFAFAQTEEELIQARKRAVELIKHRAAPPPELDCAGSAGEMDFLTTAYFFPQNRADEVYIDTEGLYYFKIENGEAILLWTATDGYVENQQPLETNNTFIRWLRHAPDGVDLAIDFTLVKQCGSLPDYQGGLEMFETFSQSFIRKGVITPDGTLTCVVESYVPEPGVTRLDQYWYGVANCDSSEK